MNFNINDTAGVKALLEQLGASQVWQETVNSTDPLSVSTTSTPTPSAKVGRGPSTSESVDAGSEMLLTSSPSSQPLSVISPTMSGVTTVPGTPAASSVASLLSQLRSSQWMPPASAPSPESVPSASSSTNIRSPRGSHPQPSTSGSTSYRSVEPKQHPQTTSPSQPLATAATDEDARFVTFQQALPRLTQLSSNSQFISAVVRLRDEQKELERQLWEERYGIRRKHEEKVKVARTKANMIGADLSKHEVDMLNDGFRRDMQKFDAGRVLLAWDALMEKQQTALEALGVPTMFRTSSQEAYEKQKKVMQVLEGLIG